MALWTGLGQAATVVGVDVGGLISKIMQAAQTARQNRRECEQLARRVFMIAELLPHVQEPEAVRQLAGLGDTLRYAHELVESCQERNALYKLVMAGRQAERFREVQSKIDFYLILFPVISHIGVTRRLDRIYNALIQGDSTRVEPSPLPESPSHLQVAQEVLAHETQEFLTAEIMAATNNFVLDTVIGSGRYGKVYRGTLHDGREVAVKHIDDLQLRSVTESLQEFHIERNILSRLRHENIIRLLGWCVMEKRKEPETEERLIVYEYMENGSLFQHLHPDQGSSSLSPVSVSWKVRMDVLLGVARTIEHLHCHANPPLIHRDIKSANILLDVSWVPHLSDFGLSVEYHHMANEAGLDTKVVGTYGYADPEYVASGCVKQSSDLYSFGVVMLEVLTGKTALFQSNDDMRIYTDLPSLAVHYIRGGKLGKLLDSRPVPKPTRRQLCALEKVAQIAVGCVKMLGKDRPAISDVVANLEMALDSIRRGEPGIPSTGSLFRW